MNEKPNFEKGFDWEQPGLESVTPTPEKSHLPPDMRDINIDDFLKEQERRDEQEQNRDRSKPEFNS